MRMAGSAMAPAGFPPRGHLTPPRSWIGFTGVVLD